MWALALLWTQCSGSRVYASAAYGCLGVHPPALCAHCGAAAVLLLVLVALQGRAALEAALAVVAVPGRLRQCLRVGGRVGWEASKVSAKSEG